VRDLRNSVAALPPEEADAKKEIATAAVQTLGADAVDAKHEIATTAFQTLGLNAVDARKGIASTALETLPPEEREEVVGRVLGPTQKISDRIWQWVVGAFAIVFVGGSGTLVASVFFLDVEQIQSCLRCSRPLEVSLLALSLEGQVLPGFPGDIFGTFLNR
jgi:hypothetical protein